MTGPFREVKPTEPRENPYVSLGLRDNPFPIEPSLKLGSPDPRINGDIYCEALHKKNEGSLQKLLIPSSSQRHPLSIAFLMDHATRRGRGIGKTAFLKHQRDMIMADYGEKAAQENAVVCAVHVLPPPSCRKFWEFCRVIVEALVDQGVVNIALWRLRAFSEVIPSDVLKEVNIDNMADTIGNDRWLTERNVDCTFTLNARVRNNLRSAGIRDQLVEILAPALGPIELHNRIFATFSDYYWRKDGGRILFDDMVKLFIAARFTRGLLLIDELEKFVLHQNMVERRAFADSLRYFLFDADFSNSRHNFWGVLLTIHPGVQEILNPHWKAAGLDGISPLAEPDAHQTTVYFGPLDKSQAIPLVKVYLDYYRTPEATTDSIEPFTKEAVTEALVKTGGVPRAILRLLHRVVERAIELKQTRIDKDLIEEVYRAHEHMEAEAINEDEMPPPPIVELTEG